MRALLDDLGDDIERVEAFVIDANGVPRGKTLSRRKAAEALDGGLPMPMSAFALDVWGRDVPAAGLAAGADSDGVCRPVAHAVKRASWAARPTAQILLSADRGEDASFADPRGRLSDAMARLAARGLTAVTAVEMEFYLADRDADARPRPPHDGRRGWAAHAADLFALPASGRTARALDDIARCAHEQDVPADAALSENGPGQFEVNLLHRADALRAADDAVLLKRIVKGVAARHGLTATFMAKPYGETAGSGMHVHASLLDRNGRNVFADGAAALRHAAAGLIEALPDTALLLAPHANSHRRLSGGGHAPRTASWGLDDRRAAIRLIEAGAATRIEHRVAGADANPYLVLAAILSGIDAGLSAGHPPAAPPDAATGLSLTGGWDAAIDRFAASPFIAFALGEPYRRLYAACKVQERAEMARRVSDVELDACLEAA